MSKQNETISIVAQGITLSANDAARLDLMAYEETGAMRAQILAKLAEADLVNGNDICADIATIGSVVHYRIGQSRLERRTLSLPDVAHPNGQFLNVLTPVGLALLGRRAGNDLSVPLADGEALQVYLHAVEFQPESEVRRRSTLMSDDGPGAA